MPSRLLLALVAAFLLAAPATASAYPTAFDWMPHNPADQFAGLAVDDLQYDRAFGCRRSPTPGAVALTKWLESNSRGVFWGTMRCEKLGPRNYSLHADGRAIDWHLDAAKPADHRVAVKLVSLLLAPDRAGNEHALARRMGVQEIIWDCKAWFGGGEGMSRYSACERKKVDRTTAHRDHIHFGLSRAGAALETSFWWDAAAIDQQDPEGYVPAAPSASPSPSPSPST